MCIDAIPFKWIEKIRNYVKELPHGEKVIEDAGNGSLKKAYKFLWAASILNLNPQQKYHTYFLRSFLRSVFLIFFCRFTKTRRSSFAQLSGA
ncbi:unnamed protein product [Allacma fusca]|uniref:Uncharacterized protein n=1 Tax=Allacma fusca TaxID=39272 RepID=A0A8J2KUU5_9HEXA|nr:unnamed protein product [Allacma fusca]